MLGTFRIWAAPRASLGCSSGLDLRSTALGAAQGGPRGAQILNVPRWGVILYQSPAYRIVNVLYSDSVCSLVLHPRISGCVVNIIWSKSSPWLGL